MSKNLIGILSLPNANIASIGYWAQRSGFKCKICIAVDDFLEVNGLIIPGVGHFDAASAFIKKHQLKNSINNFIKTGKPVLGICLGMHLFFSNSEEGKLPGINIFSSKISKLSYGNHKVPNIGWREVKSNKGNIDKFYFMHSYCLEMNQINANLFSEYTTSSCNNEFISSFSVDNIYGCQFHPEKSYDKGDQIFRKIFLGKKNNEN